MPPLARFLAPQLHLADIADAQARASAVQRKRGLPIIGVHERDRRMIAAKKIVLYIVLPCAIIAVGAIGYE